MAIKALKERVSSASSIARTLGVTEGTVRYHLHRSRGGRRRPPTTTWKKGLQLRGQNADLARIPLRTMSGVGKSHSVLMISVAMLLMGSGVALVGGLGRSPDLEMKRVFPSLVTAHELARGGTAVVFYLTEELRTVAVEWPPDLDAKGFAERLGWAVESAWADDPAVPSDWVGPRNAFRKLAQEGAIPSITSRIGEAETLVLLHSDERSLWILPTEPGGPHVVEHGWQRALAVEANIYELSRAWAR